MNYVIDAKGKSLGRVASEAAAVLRGKNRTDFAPNKAPAVKVIIENASQVKITGRKIKQKQYRRHSMYPGGLKSLRMEQVIEKKGTNYILKKAIDGMLPKNKLRRIMIKNLIIK
ncbi:50S ribosomal protein L13 [Patescibacteria group bacterium]|nr:50S ribosomal protein L13 [Patescibacteria group bacterium]